MFLVLERSVDGSTTTQAAPNVRGYCSPTGSSLYLCEVRGSPTHERCLVTIPWRLITSPDVGTGTPSVLTTKEPLHASNAAHGAPAQRIHSERFDCLRLIIFDGSVSTGVQSHPCVFDRPLSWQEEISHGFIGPMGHLTVPVRLSFKVLVALVVSAHQATLRLGHNTHQWLLQLGPGISKNVFDRE